MPPAILKRVPKQRITLRADFISFSGGMRPRLASAHGGVGCISVTRMSPPNFAPKFQTATLKGDYALPLTLLGPPDATARGDLCRTGGQVQSTGCPVWGCAATEVRMPLVGLNRSVKTRMDDAMAFCRA